MHSADRYCILL